MRIRPHHALCAQFFVGRGYSEGFVENMRRVLAKLDGDNAAVTLTDGCDEICAHCPHNDAGRCGTEEKVRRIDSRAAEALGLHCGETLPWRELRDRARREIILPGRLREICRDCEWIELCAGE